MLGKWFGAHAKDPVVVQGMKLWEEGASGTQAARPLGLWVYSSSVRAFEGLRV